MRTFKIPLKYSLGCAAFIVGANSILSLAAAAPSQPNPGQPNSPTSQLRIEATDCWEIHSLGTFGGDVSYAYDVNDSGQVVGTAAMAPTIFDPADPPRSYYPAFVSAPNGGALTAIVTDGKWGATAVAINNAGEVVGNTTIGSSFFVGFYVAPDGTWHNTLSFAYARDINNSGQTLWDLTYSYLESAIGPSNQPPNGSDPIGLVDVLVLPALNKLDVDVQAAAFNDNGQVAVTASTSPQSAEGFYTPPTAYRWSSYEGSIKLAPNAKQSFAKDINAMGQVVGVLTHEDNSQQAFVTRRYSTSLVMLGQPGDGNNPTGINNDSQIVGTRNIDGITYGYITIPFFVHQTITIDKLAEVTRDGWSNLRPEAINNRGQVAGTGTIGGFSRAFLLTPLSLQAYIPTRDGQPAKCYRSR
jgi:uncharacterized membrane protein